MISTDYVQGEMIRISVQFTDIDGNPADPDTIKLEIKDPSGNLATVEYGVDPVSKDGVGSYYYDQEADEVGRWRAYWYTEGDFIAAGDTIFHVREKATA